MLSFIRQFLDIFHSPRYEHNARWFVRYTDGDSVVMTFWNALDYAEVFGGKVMHIRMVGNSVPPRCYRGNCESKHANS